MTSSATSRAPTALAARPQTPPSLPERVIASLRRRYAMRFNPNSVRVHGVKLDLDDRWATPRIRRSLYMGWYERQEIAALRKTLRRDDVYLELGSGVGVVATVVSRLIGSDRVTAYEGNPQVVEIARRTFANNGVAPTLVNAILGDTTEDQVFYVRPDFWASNLEPGPGATPVTVPGHSFEEQLSRLGTTYVMLDIEGGEVPLLMNHTLPPRVRAVCMEVHPETVGAEAIQSVLRRLMDDGFILDTRISGEAVVFLERPSTGP